MATEYRLTYFNSRGLTEMARMLFKLAGKEFTDRRVEKGAEWDALKPTTPKGELPILEVNGKMLCESFSIAKYVAREFNLYGANNWEATTCDMVIDSLVGVFQNLFALKFLAKTEEDKAEAKKKLLSSLAATDKFVASLKKGKFVLGDTPTIADVTIHVITGIVTDIAGFDCPNDTLNKISKDFSEVPAIAEWIKTRPQTEL